MDDPRLIQVFERMIGKQIGKPVRYDPATGEFVVVSDDDQQQTEEPKQ